MNCIMTRGLYLRADGRLPCYCSAGETVTLGRLDHGNLPGDIAADVFESPAFTRIRAAMAQGKAPFPGVCEQCTYLDVDADAPDLSDGERRLEWLHFEPAYACNLDCRWCHGQARHDPGQVRMLPLETIRRLADDFAARGYTLGKGNICGVGEPTLNPDVWAMIAALKDKLGGDILLSTNGNASFSPDIVSCGLDKLKNAADATDQKTYGRYRRHGRLSRVLEFTAQVAAARSGPASPQIIWQYIMFDYNDSDADLLKYQRLAREHGVDRLRIVYTRCDNYSRRAPEDFPRDFPDILFFPIKEDSLLGVDAAEARLAQAEALVSEEPAEAARLALGLARHVFHRLLLGVERYVDLLDFVASMRPVAQGNCADLSPAEQQAFRALLGRLYRLLEAASCGAGDAPQAEAYAAFVRKAGL